MNKYWNDFSQAVTNSKSFSDVRLRKFYIAWIALIAVSAWFSEGWIQPDEHARILEPAHFLIYGYASLPWELNHETPIVSWILGYVVSPIFLLTKSFGLTGITEAAIVRFVVGLMSSTKFFALWRIFEALNLNPKRKPIYLLICMLGLFGPLFLVRTSQENFAVIFLLWAFYWALKIKCNPYKTNDVVIFGALLALTASARPQVGIAAAGIGFWFLFKMGPKIIFPSFVGLVLGLTPMALVDFHTTGIPFLPAFHYLKYALGDEDGGKVWGTSPWWFYIQQYFEAWYPPFSIILLPALLIGFKRCVPIAAIFGPFAIAHFILGHKETRYFSPMIPFMQIAIFVGWERMEETMHFAARWSSKTRFLRNTIALFIVASLIAGFVPLNTSPRMYHHLGEKIRSGEIEHFTYIGNTMTDISLLYAKLLKQPHYQQVSWNDVMSGHVRPQGWLAFYALDPEDFRQIEKSCQVDQKLNYPKWYLNLLELMPRSPARRKLNPIVYCKDPLILR